MNCIAPGCRNWLQKNPSVSYHRLPKDPQLLKKWLHVLKRKDVPARASRIYSQHFAEEDFAMKGTFDAATESFRMERSHRTTLKRSACPSIFKGYGVGVTDRSTSLTSESSKSRTEPRRRRESIEPEDDNFIPEKVFILEETVQEEAEEGCQRHVLQSRLGLSEC
ncbi:hypothetical protein J4Q44_G00282160 [Coregonus suidteri]|uniref:THAP domain-containing protein 1 n=1 Tax=Coregonus suidteri TaxID=861788 RepID=A0AAN8QLH1_9TELE